MTDDVAESFRYQRGWCEGSSPLYAEICGIVADEPALLELAALVPPERSRSNVFLASVHFLLLRGADHPLAEYYSSVADTPRDPDDALSDRLSNFCEVYEDELRPLLETRRTQTNSVRRSAALYPAFARVAGRVDGPIALVEIGPSAGLNLFWDRYRYDYGERVVGPDDAHVRLDSELRGDTVPPLPADPPAVDSRVGVDLNPLDVTDENDADWLRALTWPEHHARRRNLDGALDAARTNPPELVRGDAVEELPADVPVCVYDTLVLYQFPEDAREHLETTVEAAATERPLHWLAGEDEYGDHDGIRLGWTRAEGDAVRTDLLGVFESHGRWVEWHGA